MNFIERFIFPNLRNKFQGSYMFSGINVVSIYNSKSLGTGGFKMLPVGQAATIERKSFYCYHPTIYCGKT